MFASPVIDAPLDHFLGRALQGVGCGAMKRHPVELAALLRITNGLTTEDIGRLARNAQKAKDK